MALVDQEIFWGRSGGEGRSWYVTRIPNNTSLVAFRAHIQNILLGTARDSAPLAHIVILILVMQSVRSILSPVTYYTNVNTPAQISYRGIRNLCSNYWAKHSLAVIKNLTCLADFINAMAKGTTMGESTNIPRPGD